jgi:purine nucleosidase
MPADNEVSTADDGAPRFRIELLSRNHERAGFSCGNDSLDRFLHEHVFNGAKRDLATTYVLVSTLSPRKVLGYYSLSVTRIRADELPQELARKFPHSAEIGAILLGKLAVDHSLQGREFGRDMLFNAIERSLVIQTQIATYAIVVDAIDEGAAAFYARHGFQPFPETPMRLFLPFKVHLARVANVSQTTSTGNFSVRRIHLDTDLGGDPDDVCALAMLLGWPDVELVAITTTIDPGGLRAGYVAHCLKLAGREDIPVVAGVEVESTSLRVADPVIDDERFWPTNLQPRPSPPGDALDLLYQSIEQGATVGAIGPYTNLALLEVARPGALSKTPIVVMGGLVRPPDRGLPQWGPEMDWNFQWETRASEIVAATADLTLATLPATLKALLRAADLPRLRASGPLGDLIARQSEAHAHNTSMTELGRSHPGLPDDLLNFHYDPVACAAAVGWSGLSIEEIRLKTRRDGDILLLQSAEDGRLTRVVQDIDGPAFQEAWMSAIEHASSFT